MRILEDFFVCEKFSLILSTHLKAQKTNHPEDTPEKRLNHAA